MVKCNTFDHPFEKAVGLTENEMTYSAGMEESVVSKLPFLITTLPFVTGNEGKDGMRDTLGPEIS